MAKWREVKMGDVCLIERGGSPRPIDKYITQEKNGINWIKIGDTNESMYITSTAQKIIPEGMKKSRYVQPGDFLLSNSMSFGRPYILAIDGCIHDGWLVLRDINNVFDKHFLYYYLSAPITYQKFKSLAVGGVVNNLNSEMVRNIKVALPPLEEQRKIAAVLDKVSDLIAKRRQQLEKLDLLVKARFVEMFGNLKNNRNTTTTIEEISEMVTVGIANSATHAYDDKGIVLLRNQNIKENYLDDSDLIYITPAFANKYKSKALKKDDILVTRTGYPGVACLVPDRYAGCQTFTTLIVRLKESIEILPSFVCCYINSDNGKNFVEEMKVGVAQQNFGAKALGKMPIFVPPIEDQIQFSAFVEQIEKTKTSIKESLAKLETLKKALMQEYFEVM